MTSRSHPRGQALVLALLLLAAAGAGLVKLFDAGQLVQEKTRLTNAADAAAYSGALAQARALNFLAYTNRALVAHQVAMAHDVTLASWAQYGDTEGRQFAGNNPPAGVIGGLFGPSHAVAYARSAAAAGARLGHAAESGVGSLARAYAEHDRVVHDVLVQAQIAVQQGLPAMRDAAMRAVLAANYSPEPVHLDPAPLRDTLPGFVRRYGGPARERLKGLVLSATDRYGFLAPRDHTEQSLAQVDVRCPLMRPELRRRGSTALLGLDTWRAMDTQSYHALRSNRWIGCYYREYPMGHGAVKAGGGDAGEGVEYVDEPPPDFSDQSFWSWVQQYTQWDLLGMVSNPLANSFALGGLATWSGRGLSSYAETAGADGAATPALGFAIRVWRARDEVQAGSAADPKGRAATGLAGDSMAAIAAAETFYVRPVARADRRHEAATLFQPYWQARLSPLTDTDRRQARALQEGS